MVGPAAPINIASSSRHGSSSPSQPHYQSSGKERPRRESIANSLVGGMSWGGVSVGSWIRDDIIMTGTSPFTYQSPSYHSSSYLPKLEANFMRDFSCCGETLPSLHDLLQHYELCHSNQQVPQSYHSSSQATLGVPALAMSDSRTANTTSTSLAVPQAQDRRPKIPQQHIASQNRQQPQSGQNNMQSGPQGTASGIEILRQQQPVQSDVMKASSQNIPDIDSVEDMEMDDAIEGASSVPLPANPHGFQMRQQQQRSQFGMPTTPRAQPLNLNTTNTPNIFQAHQGLRTSQPTTPTALGQNGRPYQHNPTFSSVNTPTLTAHPMQHQHHLQTNRTSPDSSSPGTPDEPDSDFVGNLASEMSIPNNPHYLQGGNPVYGYQFGDVPDMLNLCIDDPAKRLSSPNGGYGKQHQIGFGGGQLGRNQALLSGLSGNIGGAVISDDPKPYKCPVIGCEKAYKNQNGLKYHRGHGHNTQQLQENSDGTFSIVNPETSIPYPGTMGMEKEKPYYCEACKKRYKNLNGLKYHKQHSPQCSTDAKHIGSMTNMSMQNMNINVAGGGLPGIGEDSIL